MTALEICLALGLDRVLSLHRDPAWWAWHRRWYDWLVQRGLAGRVPGWSSVALLLLPPLAALLWLDQVLPQWLASLLAVVVLLHAFGARDLYRISDRYVEAAARGDGRALEDSASELGAEAVARAAAAPSTLVRQVLHQYFAPLFWALLLGPAGALLVRACSGWLDTRAPGYSALRDRLRELLALLDWIPARLALVLFGIVGNFDAAWNAWQPRRLAMPLYNANLRQIEAVALAAAGVQAGADAVAMKAVRGLMMRALVLVFGVLLLAAVW